MAAIRRDSGRGAFGICGDFALAVALTKGTLEGAIAATVGAVAGLVGTAHERASIFVAQQRPPHGTGRDSEMA